MEVEKINFSFKYQAESLYEVFKRVSEMIDNKSALDILKHFRVKVENGRFEAMGTDLYQGYKEWIEVVPEGQGEVCLPQEIVEVLKVMGDEEVDFEVKEGKVFIKGERAYYELPVLGVEDYPAFEFSGDATFEVFLNKENLAVILEKLEPFVARNEGQFVLAGILFNFGKDRLICVSSNGHLLGKIEMENNLSITQVDEEVNLIIPYKSVRFLKRLCKEKEDDGFNLKVSGNLFSVKGSNFEYMSRVIEGQYPDWRVVFPVEFKGKAEVNTEELEKALTKVTVLSKGNYKAVHFTFVRNEDLFAEKNGKVKMKNADETKGKGEVEISCNFEAEQPFSVYLNGEYIKSFLKVYDYDEVEINFIDDRSPLLFKGRDNFVFLLMPMVI